MIQVPGRHLPARTDATETTSGRRRGGGRLGRRFERQYQIVVDPDRRVGFGLTLADLTRSVRDANAEVGARVLELAGREYVLRGRGYVKDLADLEQSVVSVGAGGTPLRLRGRRERAVRPRDSSRCARGCGSQADHRRRLPGSRRPIFFSLLLITSALSRSSRSPVRLGVFTPLAYTKTVGMFAAAILSITLAPPLMVLLLKGRFRTEQTNPVSRCLTVIYRPIAILVVRCRVVVVGAAAVRMIATVPVFQRLGSEFMPPLDEGALLVMPTTFPGISIEEARRAMQRQHRTIRRS